MEYTIQTLSQLAGVSTRTLRYYDEIGILKPARISSSGYRIYGQAEVDRLQQILFYKELGVSLDRIKGILTSPDFNRLQALQQHREQLLDRRRQLDTLIANVEKTIASAEGRMVIQDREKFAGFKRQWMEENERKYGAEVRAKYGDDAVDRSNEKLLSMTPEQYEEVKRLEAAVKETLAKARQTGDPAGELAQHAADLHRLWLGYFWSDYSQEAHAGLAQMYVEDERFRDYYDETEPGTAEFLRDAILIYTGLKPMGN